MHRLAPGNAERAVLRVAVITEYMPYARHVAARYGVRGQAAEDFLQAAYVGLVKAVDHFDPDFGTTSPHLHHPHDPRGTQALLPGHDLGGPCASALPGAQQ